jgi:8-oxo-dGTP pyrophosphatase MutT (NUDIX family)
MVKHVRAAGGLVTIGSGDELRVLVVHRPHYDDWSLPKGKLDPGETDLECALREVLEETGVHAIAGDELEPVEYVDHRGRPKTVRLWRMTLDPAHHADPELEPPFTPNDEVDEQRWLSPSEAGALLSYDKDRSVVWSALGKGPN